MIYDKTLSLRENVGYYLELLPSWWHLTPMRLFCFTDTHTWKYVQTEMGHAARNCRFCPVMEELVPDYGRFISFPHAQCVPGGPRGVYETKWERFKQP